MFGDKLDIEVSCLDPQCDGTIVAQFEGNEETELVSATCSSCQHMYDINRSNYSDYPDGECGWKVIPHGK